MLRAGGFDARLQLEASADFYGPTTDNGSWDVSIGTFTAGPGVARPVALMEIFDPDGLPFVGSNFFRWGTIDSSVSGKAVNEYRSLVARLRAAYDPAEAAQLALEAEGILADQMVVVPLMTADRPGVAYRADELSGPATNPAEGVAWNIAEWTRQVDASAP
jgi:ABC-type transport system substrate-binding protein